VVVEGAEHLPAHGRALLVANHGGALPWDALVLMAALARAGRAVRPLVEDGVMTAPFLGTFLNRMGCVRASQENATRLLGRGEPCLVFPEGMLGLTKRFGRGGFVRLAVRTETPLLPVAVVGAEETAPLLGRIEALSGLLGDVLPHLPITPTFPFLGPLGLLPLPARWHIRVGEPIDARHTIADEGDAVAVNELAGVVRDRIQKDVADLVARRGNAWL
jgi:1-acyl-sn-glycerol-3-phosphate acyltransferase